MDEPGEFDKPLPSLLTKALELFKDELTLEELADDVGVNERELEMILQSQRVPQELINSFKRSEAVDVVPKVTLLSPPRS